MKVIKISREDLVKRLRKDPRLKEEYIENLELPLAFATGNKFLRNYILEKSDYTPESRLQSDWFQFSQLLVRFEVDENKIEIEYDEDRETHPPLMSRV